VWAAWPADEVERALSDGCAALPQVATALAEGDRKSFDAAADQAQRVGFAAFRGGDLTDNEQLISDATAADAAFSTLYLAAYAPAEAVSGATVWRGRELTSHQQATVEAGLVACEGY
jgi:hypothetical protein